MSAVGKKPVTFELADAAIYALSADGTSLTYGSKIDIPGVMEVTLTPGEVRTVKMQGDNKIHEIHTRVLSYKVKARMSAADFDVFAALTGGTAATAGTTPNTTSSITVKDTDTASYFKLSSLTARAVDYGTANGANGKFNAYKVKMTSPPVVPFGANEQVWEWEGEAIGTSNDNKIWDFTHNETAATLA